MLSCTDHPNSDVQPQVEKSKVSCYGADFASSRARFINSSRCSETLKRVLGERDMSAFRRKWETFVLGLRNS